MDNILFSVIIPTYNRAGLIARTLRSVIAQSYDNYEIIIIDDGSTDNTAEVVKPFLNHRISYHRISNSERAVARNEGMKLAKGDYITFLDSDDIYYRDYFANALQSLLRNNLPVFFHLAYESWSESDNKSLEVFSVKNGDVYSLIKGNHLSCIGVFLKRNAIDGYRFNEDRNLSGSEDWELWLRMAARFGLVTDNRVSAALIIHDSRSVYTYDESKLLNRKNLALQYSFEDPDVTKVYGKHRNAMEAYCDTYIALHLALSATNAKALKYLFHAVYYYPSVLFTKRTLAVCKYILLNAVGRRKNTISA